MRSAHPFQYLLIAALTALAACSSKGRIPPTPKNLPTVVAPGITTTDARNGAVVVALTSSTSGANIYYTVDGSMPGKASTEYTGPFLVATTETVTSVATAPGYSDSSATSQTFSLNIPSGTLVWADEFDKASGSDQQPNPAVWTYDSGGGGWGNHELEIYCGWNSSTSPCTNNDRNVYVGSDGNLHIVARRTPGGLYTSARIKTQGLLNFQYGRVEVRAQVPEGQGLWAAGWLLGSNISDIAWPACGEMDIFEHATTVGFKDAISGSIHGAGFTGPNLGKRVHLRPGKNAAAWHTYGMIWSKGKVAYYMDDPRRPYTTFTPKSLRDLPDAVWPFDAGPSFLLLNIAVGGEFTSPPTASTRLPEPMLVDYIRIYSN